MWIVRLALRLPYTSIVMALLMMIFGGVALKTMPTDIFPDIDIPVISVIWTYNGLSADEFEKRITVYSEYALSANVNDVKSMESQTLDGVGVIRLYFHPTVKVDTAIAQATAVSQAILRRMPPSVQPPILLRYTAASVPIVQLSLSSPTLSESELYDYGIFRVRQALAVVQGTTLPAPYGGKVRQLRVDLDLAKLQGYGLSPRDVNNAINAQNLVAPSGKAKIGDIDYRVKLNNSPIQGDELNDIPVSTKDGKTVFLRDVAHVHDGSEVQQNIVRSGGQRSVLLTILKNGSASTLDIVKQILGLVPTMQAAAPKGMKIEPLFDQSVFVQAAVDNVLEEGLIAACLTGTLILLFLGSWRSTLIVLVSIPLSILTSVIALQALGLTINIMTLGGLALAIGILVDDATVEIENVHRNLAMGKPLYEAILDGAEQIAAPALVATLCICIVFVSVVLLEGPARFLFIPFALAVVFAVFTSYILSRTLVPVMVHWLLAKEILEHQKEHKPGAFMRFHLGFMALFEKFREFYGRILFQALRSPGTTLLCAAILLGSAAILFPQVGRDFFPTVDAGQFRLHVKGASGQRIEKTEEMFSEVEAEIRKQIPADEIGLLIDNIGVPSESFNLAFGDSATVGTSDGEILVSLKPNRSKPTPEYVRLLRNDLNAKFPKLTFYFQPADIVSQILNFGLPAPIDVRVAGYNRPDNLKLALKIRDEISQIPGAVDVHIHQETDAPTLELEANRELLSRVGLTQHDLSDDMLISLSSNTQVTPNYWIDPNFGIPYFVAVQTPPQQVASVEDLMRTPISTKSGSQLLQNLARVHRGTENSVINHSNIQPVYDIYANVQSTDLGTVAEQVNAIVAKYGKEMAPGNRLYVRGLVESMDSAFFRLGLGFVGALVLVYLLLVVNYQSFSDAFIIIAALPGAGCGIVWALFLTHTTFNVPSMMGAIMSLGVATANSVLMVSFAKERMEEGDDPQSAAHAAGFTRLRPVLMTATAMVIGMLPMSLGLGQGGEQNAPLGRAVIGGLSVATLFTLFFVPVVFKLLRQKRNPQ